MGELVYFSKDRRPSPQTPRQIAQNAEYFRHARQQIRTAMFGVLICAIVAVLCAALGYAFLAVAYLANSAIFVILGTAAALIAGYFAYWGKSEYDEYRAQRSCYRDHRIHHQAAPRIRRSI